MVTALACTQDRWWIFPVWGLTSENWSMAHPVLLCYKCCNKGVSLMACKASLTSRHLRKMSFLTLSWRRGCCRAPTLFFVLSYLNFQTMAQRLWFCFNLGLLPMLQILMSCFFIPNQNSGFPTSSTGGWQVCEFTYRGQTSSHRAASGYLHDCG